MLVMRRDCFPDGKGSAEQGNWQFELCDDL